MKKKCNVEVYSRVTGFYRPVRQYNPGKTEEFKDRKTFNIEKKENAETKVSNSSMGRCL